MMDRDQRPSSPYRDEMRRQVDLADRGAFATQRCESHRFVTPVEMGKMGNPSADADVDAMGRREAGTPKVWPDQLRR
jgi:hypothetical protein